MTIPSYQVDAALNALKDATSLDLLRPAMVDVLEAAFSATPPEEVVTEEMDKAGVKAYQESPHGMLSAEGDCPARIYRVMHSARPKVSSEAPVDGAYAPEEERKLVRFESAVAVGVVPGRTDGMLSLHVGSAVIMLDPTEAHRLALDLTFCANLDPARHKPRTESTPHDLPIKYQRNVGGVQTISYNTRKAERRSHHAFGALHYFGNYSVERRAKITTPSDRRSPKGAA